MAVVELSPETLQQAKEVSLQAIMEATQNYDHWEHQVAVLKEDLKEAKENLEMARERLLALLRTLVARN